MKFNKLLAKSISYAKGKRSKLLVKFQVVHGTGNKSDTAENNAKYFATSNTRQAGAHFFISRDGDIWRSIPMNRTAYAVGGFFTQSDGAGSYYGKCTNANSISVELCDVADKDPSWEQLVALRKLTKYIKKYCPMAKTIIRHWDVNGKTCPTKMTGTKNEVWEHLHNYITKGYQFKGKVTTNAVLRSSGKVADNKIGSKKKGSKVYITKIVGNWGRLKKKSITGKYRWISLKKVKEL